MASERGATSSVAQSQSTSSEPVDLASATTAHSLTRAVYARRSEYVRPHRIRIKVGTWNVAGCPGTDKDLASWFIAGKGIDEDLATLDLAHNAAVDHTETQDGSSKDTLDHGGKDQGQDENEVRLIGGDKIGLYVLGLQEIIDLNLAKEAYSRVYADPPPKEKWRAALEAMMPKGYQLVVAEQMSGILLLIYASPEVAPTISNVSTVQVGTGLLGYMGNKGAVTTRILLGETTRLVFVNCHLASGADDTYLERRCWDVGQILQRTQFDPIDRSGVLDEEGEKIGDEDFAFWFGDLNFRLDGIPGDDIRRLLRLHSLGEYDLSKRKPKAVEDSVIITKPSDSDSEYEVVDRSASPSPEQSFEDQDTSIASLPDPDDFLQDPHQDPASLQATLDSLLPHDQLSRMMKQKKVFHDGWRESSITFLPSYKYDVGTVSLFDSSEKQRAPSWCDRVLYRTRRDRDEYLKKTKEEEEARKRDEDMKARGLDQAAEDDNVLFSYDPENDGQQPADNTPPEYEYDEYEDGDGHGDPEVEEVVTKEGFLDRIQLDIYTSHQRITSSDHKPIITMFTLDYDAVVPELKAKVHAEVARELDRAENEGRPDITIVVDRQNSGANSGHGQGQGMGHGASDAVEFGPVAYLRKQTCSLTVANTGGVPAVFSFVSKPSAEDDGVSGPGSGPGSGSPGPQWLTTSFVAAEAVDGEPTDLGKEVTLEPGETAGVLLEVLVDDLSHVRDLNHGKAKLEDVLVLQVVDGRHCFVPVKGTWLPTSLGRSIEELIRVPQGGIRAFPKANGPIPHDSDVHSATPKELFKLTEGIDVLMERVLADENMLEGCQVPHDALGWPFDEAAWKLKDKAKREAIKASIIEALDTDTPLLESLPVEHPAIEKMEVLCETLLLLLSSLTDGIITSDLWARIETALPNMATTPITADDLEDTKTAVLDILSAAPHHNVSFVFLTATLAKVVAELAPLIKDADSAASPTSPVRSVGGVLGRRSLSFRKVVSGADGARARRRARERRVAEIVAGVCFGGDRGATERKGGGRDRRRGLLEIFVRKEE